ncbi:hypothetical protein [Hyphomicrobium sulfonivorans]|uniref:hypothetical protein n=1 Tax=Hyphomicrobium sulfonivorans TaxID=121290 RepID=UPI00156EF9A6|nr:hypothetical protein [Hyphomicrobium sulfonivorans]MBI1650123.1 hypothetical protein [Hyphomicrobium sulfonivorans]NSL73038.1 hypothetical protein [Hyphomicrobium sulfonivorans]
MEKIINNDNKPVDVIVTDRLVRPLGNTVKIAIWAIVDCLARENPGKRAEIEERLLAVAEILDRDQEQASKYDTDFLRELAEIMHLRTPTPWKPRVVENEE